MTPAPPVAGWHELYRRHRDDLFLSRLHWGAGLTMAGVLGLMVLFSLQGLHDWAHTGFGVIYAFIGIAGGVLTLTGVGRRHLDAVGGAVILGLIANMALSFPHTPDQQYAAPSALVATILGSALYFPFTMHWQAFIGLAAVGAHCWILMATGTVGAAEITLVASAAAASVVSANLIEKYRVTSFERAWQQEQLGALARELAQCLEPATAAAAVSARARELLGCPWTAVSLQDEARHLFRVEYATAAPDRQQPNLAGIDIPNDYPGVREVLERGIFVLPEDEPHHPVWAPVHSWGLERVLYIAMRHGADVVGILQFGWYTKARTTPSERTLAQALANQAALAFRTVNLVGDLRRANRHKSDFVSMVSHELRTPMNVIMGMTDMVLDSAISTEQHDLLSRVRHAADGLLSIINNILDLSRIDAGKMTIGMVDMNIRTTIRDVVSLLLVPAEHKHLTLRGAVADDVPEQIYSDPERLRQVLTNLVGNAIKFTKQGSVSVEAALVPDGPGAASVRIVVRDTGIGIPQEQQAAVFESFTQVDESGVNGRTGTGLGLAISRQLITLMGGTIGVDSVFGQGSAFWVELPLRPSVIATDRLRYETNVPEPVDAYYAPAAEADDNLRLV